jgi:hypothetical protein
MPKGIYIRTEKNKVSKKTKIILSQKMKGNNFGWKGDKIGYHGIHAWLRREFGKANKCENINCEHKSKRFNYALLREHKMERKKENFWMLCQSCHEKYDITKKQKLKLYFCSKNAVKNRIRNKKGQFIGMQIK